MAQRIKDPVLSPPWLGFDLWPWNLYMLQVQPKKKKEREREKESDIMCFLMEEHTTHQ